jgi:hypothetical protein
MQRPRIHTLAAGGAGLLALSLFAVACSTQARETTRASAAAVDPLQIDTTAVEKQPLERFLRVTGSLMADEQAEVSAETAGRVIGTPVERGTRPTPRR